MQPSRSTLACGVLGPAAFVGAWVGAGLLRPGYDPVQEAISQLAREGTAHRLVMTAGFVAFGVLVPVYARALGARLGTGTQAAATVAGLGTLAVAALPLSAAGGQTADRWHAAAAAVAYAGQVGAPLLGARGLGRLVPGSRAPSYAVAGGALVCLAGSVPDSSVSGLLQRAGLTVVDLWYAAVAVHLLRRA